MLGGSAVGQRQGVLVRPTGKSQTWEKVTTPLPALGEHSRLLSDAGNALGLHGKS